MGRRIDSNSTDVTVDDNLWFGLSKKCMVEWREGISPLRSPRTGHEPLDSSSSYSPAADCQSCHWVKLWRSEAFIEMPGGISSYRLRSRKRWPISCLKGLISAIYQLVSKPSKDFRYAFDMLNQDALFLAVMSNP
jgi:hypothetical protein